MSSDHFGSDDFNKQDESSMAKFIVIFVVLMMVLSIIASVAVIYFIIDCLKKAVSAIPQYVRIANSDYNSHSSKPKVPANNHHSSLPMEPLLQNSNRFPTVERFLSKFAREKPVRFSPDDIKKFTNSCSTVLGKGSYGVVFKGEFPNGVPLAVKILTTVSKKMEEQFMAEVSTIGKTYHGNLVALYGFCFHSSMIALVYEFMENGPLNKLFDRNRAIEWERLHDIGVNIAKGIAYLHEECRPSIIHYDIKPDNVLLDGNLNPKVADFGLAKLCERDSQVMSGGKGTPGYAAPEVWNRNFPVTIKCDVYSFGIMLFEIVGRRRHFVENATESQQWLPTWAWDMHKKNELDVMLSQCGIEERHKEKARRMSVVGLHCVQKQPDARPLMSNVAKMLEGSMDVPQILQNPFEHLQPFIPRFSATMNNESDSDSSMSGQSGYRRVMSEINRHQPRQGIEIELATI